MLRAMRRPAQIIDSLFMVIQFTRWEERFPISSKKKKIPNIDLSHIILFHGDERNIILIVFVPADPQQRLVSLIQNIAFALIPTVKFSAGPIGPYSSKNVGVWGKTYIKNFFIVCDQLFYSCTGLDIPD
jgi:hypothetical protein